MKKTKNVNGSKSIKNEPTFSGFIMDIDPRTIQKVSGSYVIHAIKRNKPIAIHRLLGIDKEGILYIGQTKDFKSRVVAMKKTIGEQKNKYPALKPYLESYEFNRPFINKYPKECLFLTFYKSNKPDEDEYIQFADYIKKYGELPPLNNQLSNHNKFYDYFENH